jgi:hypothetical protein
VYRDRESQYGLLSPHGLEFNFAVKACVRRSLQDGLLEVRRSLMRLLGQKPSAFVVIGEFTSADGVDEVKDDGGTGRDG